MISTPQIQSSSMPPLDQIQFSVRAREELSLKKQESFNASLTSEISVKMLLKAREDERINRALSSGWNPEELDYSLNVLLHSKDGIPSVVTDSVKESLLGSNYSLDVSLSSKAASPSSDLTRKTAPTEIETKPSRQKSKVRFYHRVRIQRVTNRLDLSEEEVKGIWYSREEFKEIRQDCFSTIKIMTGNESVDSDDDEEFCSRGLEYKTKEAYKERLRNKQEIRLAVLDEQEFQSENDMDDPEWIAKLSRDESRLCVKAAILAAKKDEQESREYLLSR
jgi:hypothetical protein